MSAGTSQVCAGCVEFLVLESDGKFRGFSQKAFCTSLSEFKQRIQADCPLCKLLYHALPPWLISSEVWLWPHKGEGAVNTLNLDVGSTSCSHAKIFGEGVSSMGATQKIAYRNDAHNVDQSTKTLDFASLRSNLDRCLQDSCIDRQILYVSDRRLRNLCVVDVDNMCLVSMLEGCRYFALSYVWGKAPVRFQTMTKNRQSLMRPKALEHPHVLSKLPLTVRDAMTLTARLGERYLWVDRLCIDQDSGSEKHTQIAQMDLIFARSLMTIVALSATSSESPLRGVRPGTLIPSVRRESVCGAVLEVVSNPYTHFIDSILQKRGWIYQEQLFSVRKLFFTGSTAIYQCQNGHDEDFIREILDAAVDKKGLSLASLPCSAQRVDLPPFSLFDYHSLVGEYSRRSLSYPQDAVNAFSGVLSALYGDLEHHTICGLPYDSLGSHLLWRTHSSDSPERIACFPSWIWAAWQGQVYWPGRKPRSEARVWEKEFCDNKMSIAASAVFASSKEVLVMTCQSMPVFGEHICHKLPLSDCQEELDWYVDLTSSLSGIRQGRICFDRQYDLSCPECRIPNSRGALHLIKVAELEWELIWKDKFERSCNGWKPVAGVLVVDFVSGHHAHRVGTGYVLMDEWERMSPQDMTVCLH